MSETPPQDHPATRGIGLVSPGAMGSAIGRSLRANGARVVVALGMRAPRSRERAEGAGLVDVGTVAALVAECDLVVSVVPPASALEVANTLTETAREVKHQVTVVDANAISPQRAREVARIIEAAGWRYVDGGIVGGPPRPGGRTDLLVSGAGADELAGRLTTAELVVTSIGPDPTAASTLKMCHAAWSKGTSALLISIRALARNAGVDDALGELWGRVQPAVFARSESEGSVAGRAWRWVDEMSEIARHSRTPGSPVAPPPRPASSTTASPHSRMSRRRPRSTNWWRPCSKTRAARHEIRAARKTLRHTPRTLRVKPLFSGL